MGKLEKIRMVENAEVLNEEDMKLILGGYQYASACYSTDTWGQQQAGCSGACTKGGGSGTCTRLDSPDLCYCL